MRSEQEQNQKPGLCCFTLVCVLVVFTFCSLKSTPPSAVSRPARIFLRDIVSRSAVARMPSMMDLYLASSSAVTADERSAIVHALPSDFDVGKGIHTRGSHGVILVGSGPREQGHSRTGTGSFFYVWRIGEVGVDHVECSPLSFAPSCLIAGCRRRSVVGVGAVP
jgi:hypothetical protein